MLGEKIYFQVTVWDGDDGTAGTLFGG